MEARIEGTDLTMEGPDCGTIRKQGARIVDNGGRTVDVGGGMSRSGED